MCVHCLISAMKLIRSSSRARPYQLSYAELQLSPPLFPLLAELLPGNCDPVPVYCFSFCFCFWFRFCFANFACCKTPLHYLTSFFLTSFLSYLPYPYLIPFLSSFPPPPHPVLQPLEVVARPRAPSSCRKLPSLTAHVFFTFPHTFSFEFSACVYFLLALPEGIFIWNDRTCLAINIASYRGEECNRYS